MPAGSGQSFFLVEFEMFAMHNFIIFHIYLTSYLPSYLRKQKRTKPPS